MPFTATIREKSPSDHEEIAQIADSLTGWFNEEGKQNIRIDLPHLGGYVAVDESGRSVGFLLFFVYEARAHIAWMGVRLEYHRRGIGKSLVQRFEADMLSAGVRELEVYTLGDSVDYEPYERTRAFYYAMGFNVYKREKHDSPACPESIHLRKKPQSQWRRGVPVVGKGICHMREVEPYTSLSRIYWEHDWEKFADRMVGYVAEAAERYGDQPVSVLDLGCGTGRFLRRWEHPQTKRRVGIDRSSQMAAIASVECTDRAEIRVGDFTELELGEKFSVIACLFDTLNYCTEVGQCVTTLSAVRRHLEEEGLFVFDTNTAAGHKRVWGGMHSLVMHEANPRIVSDSGYDAERRLAYLRFTCPEEEVYEVHWQRSYDLADMPRLLEETGFNLRGAFNCFTWNPADKTSPRIFWVTSL